MTGHFQLTREITLRSIHHLENPRLTPEENRSLYSVCYRTHGHDYKVRVSVTGSLDPRSGWIIDRDQMDRILRDTLIEPFDGADLNDHFANTSCEALAVEFYRRLEPHFPAGTLSRVAIQETPKNTFEYP